MANELLLNVSAVYSDAKGLEASSEVRNKYITLTTAKCFKTSQTVGTTPEALVLGDVATRGFVILVNRDDTNYVEVFDEEDGTVIGKMFPGEPYGPVRLGSGAQSPWVQANTDPCEVDVLLFAV